MARETGSLKNKQVQKLTRVGKPGRHYDGRGLRLEIKGANSASWVTRYQIDGVTRYMGLGSAFDFTLAEARERNRKLARQKIADGTDPVLARRAERTAKLAANAKAMTFAEACRRFLEQHSAKWDSVKHRAQWRSTLTTYATPILGALPVADVDVPLVLKVLEQPVQAALGYPAGALWQARCETANRLRGRIEAVLDWAKARGHRSGDNPAAWQIIGKVLPARGARRHHAALPYKDVPAFMQALREQPGVSPKALQFLIYTAARSQEVLKVLWDEIDFDAGVWTVAADRMKARKPHRVPLAPEVVSLLHSLYVESDNDFVFIGTQVGKPLAHTALALVLTRMGQDATVHGFRSAFRDWAGETTAYPHDICEAALAHVRGDKSVQAYARGDLFDKRRALMESWAKFCAAPPAESSAEVVPMLTVRRARRGKA